MPPEAFSVSRSQVKTARSKNHSIPEATLVRLWGLDKPPAIGRGWSMLGNFWRSHDLFNGNFMVLKWRYCTI